MLHEDDENIHDTRRAVRPLRDLICQKPASDRQLERAKAQDFPVPIARGIFSSMLVLEVTSPGIPRSRRQLAGL